VSGGGVVDKKIIVTGRIKAEMVSRKKWYVRWMLDIFYDDGGEGEAAVTATEGRRRLISIGMLSSLSSSSSSSIELELGGMSG